MDIKGFIENFETAVEGIAKDSVTPATIFRDIEQWDSMAALSVIAMIDAEYGMQVTADEMVKCKTVEDLFKTVAAKK